MGSELIVMGSSAMQVSPASPSCGTPAGLLNAKNVEPRGQKRSARAAKLEERAANDMALKCSGDMSKDSSASKLEALCPPFDPYIFICNSGKKRSPSSIEISDLFKETTSGQEDSAEYSTDENKQIIYRANPQALNDCLSESNSPNTQHLSKRAIAYQANFQFKSHTQAALIKSSLETNAESCASNSSLFEADAWRDTGSSPEKRAAQPERAMTPEPLSGYMKSLEALC